MKKSAFIVVLLLLLVSALWAGATYRLGIGVEKRYHALLKQATAAHTVKLTNESYDRGFFSSKARTVVEIHQPSGAAGDAPVLQLTLAHDITHGPIPLVKSPDGKWQIKPVMAIIETRIVLSPEPQGFLSELVAQVPEIASTRDHTVVYLDGHGEEALHIPALQHIAGDEDKTAVDWKGLSFHADFAADFKKFSGTLSIPGLRIATKDADLNITEVKSAFDIRQDLNGLSLGEASFALAGIEIKDKKETEPLSFMVRGFSANASNKASGDNINCSVAVRTEQLQLSGAPYSQGVFEMELRNIDAASLAKLQQAIHELQDQFPQQSAEEMQMRMLARYGEILPGMLKKSPELEIARLEVKSPDGSFTGKSKIAFDGTKPESALNLFMLAGAITAQAEFTAGESFLRRVISSAMKDEITTEMKKKNDTAPDDEEIDTLASMRTDERLNTLVAQGFLVKENGNFGANASYKEGQIVLNGHSLPIHSLLQ